MSTPVIVIILIVLALLLIFWLVRSRGNTTGDHIDTSVTALGAVTEAVEELVDDVVHVVEDALGADAAASGAKAGDVSAAMSNSAAIMASGGATAGAMAMTEIGVPAAQGDPDNLRQIKGVGPKLGTLLTSLGITRFDQIAAWGADEIARVDAHLGTFKGRIVRDNWVEQAGFLAVGDVAGFEAKFGKLDSPTNR